MRLTTTINTYFSMLIVTVIASGAALIIVHVGTAQAFSPAGETGWAVPE